MWKTEGKHGLMPVIVNGMVSDNTATDRGGGIFNNGGTLNYPLYPNLGTGNTPNNCIGGGVPWCP